MNFSVCVIAKNEAKTLPRLVESLKEFQSRGGVIIVLDTGSTDGTPEIARSLGCQVEEVGERFITVIDKELADKINDRFLVDGELPIVNQGDKLFDYSGARNYLATLSPTDMIAMPDCDEVFTKFDIDKIEQAIKDGAEQLEYNFVFSHDEFGNEAIKFLHSKFYNRTKAKWVGIVHEVLSGDVKRRFLDENIIKLEHWQNPSPHRSRYLPGLALDCYLNPDNDRNSHYFGRELVWTKRPKSGIKELQRHISMNRWLAERAQSMIYIGDAYGQLNNPDKQAESYFKAFYMDGSRREPLIRLARFFEHNKNYQSAVVFALSSLEIPWTPFYANHVQHYTYEPHEILYRSYGWLGNIPKAQEHIKKCLEYKPMDSNYLRDLRFYFSLPTIDVIIPHIEGTRPEGLKEVINSIKAQNYPDLIKIYIEGGDETVPVKVNRVYRATKGEYIVYAADDVVFHPNDFIIAVWEALKGKSLVAFNTGVRNPEGYICEHFLISRKLADELGGIFDEDFHHVGVDDLLWKKCEKLGVATLAENTRTKHNHFSRLHEKHEPDEVIKKGWSRVEEDRKLLKKKLSEL